MAQSFKNRIFGSDVPNRIKKKIEARQLMAKKDRDPNAQIKPSKYPDSRGPHYKYDELNRMNFGGVADLSSRTPAVRMWLAVNISQDVKDDNLLENEDDIKAWWKKKDNPSSEFAGKDVFLRKVDEKSFEQHEWVKLSNSRRIYQIGNHILNTFKADPNMPISEKAGSGDSELSSDIVRSILPLEHETDRNAFLKPPAGITSVKSETEGSLGAVKKTTVAFTVHNFSDFERINLRYFLKPGAQIFIDFGWDTGLFYDPETILGDEAKIQDKLFGNDGYVTLSDGDLETVFGHVVDYNASVREDGGFDCSVEIISKNNALLSTTFDSDFKDKIARGLDIELLGAAVSGILGNPAISVLARQWGQHTNNEEQLKVQLVKSSLEMLGGTLSQRPGEAGQDRAGSQLASR